MLQFADLHAFEHDATDVDCHICQMVSSEDVNDGFIPSIVLDIPEPILLPIDTTILSKDIEKVTAITLLTHNNKAPPRA